MATNDHAETVMIRRMPYSVEKSIDIDFSHHVSGHMGACINIHGHTWKFSVRLAATKLNDLGFVVDFKQLKHDVLLPVFEMLDHSLALSTHMYNVNQQCLREVGKNLLATREQPLPVRMSNGPIIHNVINEWPGGMKLTVFPFNPTSERLAEWLFGVVTDWLLETNQLDRVVCHRTAVYEALVPVQSVAFYTNPYVFFDR